MRVLFSSTSGWGHVQPMLPLAVAMRARGHDIVFATAEDARPRVEAARIRMVPAGLTWAQRLGEYRRRWPESAALTGPEIPPHMFPRLFGSITAPSTFTDLAPFVDDWKPDVVVHDAADFAAPILATVAGIPNVTHGFGSVTPKERVAAAAARTEALWRSRGLEPLPFNGCYEHLYIDIYPPSMQPPEDQSYLGRVQRLRPASHDSAAGDELPASVAAAVADAEIVVYLTFGTIFNLNPTLASAVAALARLDDAVAVVTVGPSGDVEALGRQPAHVHIARYIPQSELLPRCSAVASHAGSGTLLGALALGIPQVCLPQAADQFRNAEACAAAGAGIALIGAEATTDAIEAALLRALDDPGMRRSAQRIQSEIAAMPSPDQVATVIENL